MQDEPTFLNKSVICHECGNEQEQKHSSKLRKVNWILTLVMSVVFGTLGVDRFIMGHIGLGILKLLSLGGCGVWWLIDVILIATKYNFKDIEWETT